MNRPMQRIFTCFLTVLLIGMGLGSTPALAANSEGTVSSQGAQLFEVQCAGCHLNGGNIVRRGKTLKLKALQKNQVDTLEAIVAIVTNGKNNMSAYKDRLTPQEIETVSAYVLQQAQKDWK